MNQEPGGRSSLLIRILRQPRRALIIVGTLGLGSAAFVVAVRKPAQKVIEPFDITAAARQAEESLAGTGDNRPSERPRYTLVPSDTDSTDMVRKSPWLSSGSAGSDGSEGAQGGAGGAAEGATAPNPEPTGDLARELPPPPEPSETGFKSQGRENFGGGGGSGAVSSFSAGSSRAQPEGALERVVAAAGEVFSGGKNMIRSLAGGGSSRQAARANLSGIIKKQSVAAPASAGGGGDAPNGKGSKTRDIDLPGSDNLQAREGNGDGDSLGCPEGSRPTMSGKCEPRSGQGGKKDKDSEGAAGNEDKSNTDNKNAKEEANKKAQEDADKKVEEETDKLKEDEVVVPETQGGEQVVAEVTTTGEWKNCEKASNNKWTCIGPSGRKEYVDEKTFNDWKSAQTEGVLTSCRNAGNIPVCVKDGVETVVDPKDYQAWLDEQKKANEQTQVLTAEEQAKLDKEAADKLVAEAKAKEEKKQKTLDEKSTREERTLAAQQEVQAGRWTDCSVAGGKSVCKDTQDGVTKPVDWTIRQAWQQAQKVKSNETPKEDPAVTQDQSIAKQEVSQSVTATNKTSDVKKTQSGSCAWQTLSVWECLTTTLFGPKKEESVVKNDSKKWVGDTRRNATDLVQPLNLASIGAAANKDSLQLSGLQKEVINYNYPPKPKDLKTTVGDKTQVDDKGNKTSKVLLDAKGDPTILVNADSRELIDSGSHYQLRVTPADCEKLKLVFVAPNLPCAIKAAELKKKLKKVGIDSKVDTQKNNVGTSSQSSAKKTNNTWGGSFQKTLGTDTGAKKSTDSKSKKVIQPSKPFTTSDWQETKGRDCSFIGKGGKSKWSCQ